MAASSIPDNMSGSLTVYKGDSSVSRRQRISDSEVERIPFSVSLGFAVLRAIVLRNLQQTLDRHLQRTLVTTLQIAVKPSTVAAQSRFIVLTDENFEQTVNRIYKNVCTRQHV